MFRSLRRQEYDDKDTKKWLSSFFSMITTDVKRLNDGNNVSKQCFGEENVSQKLQLPASKPLYRQEETTNPLLLLTKHFH
jgi:hypothetical protein